jgi:AraC family transcriptional regulator
MDSTFRTVSYPPSTTPSPTPSGYLGRGTYFGHVRPRYECAGLSLTEVHHEEPIRLPQHAHEAAYLCLLVDGSYQETFGRTTLMYRPFTLALHPSGLVHRDEIGAAGGRFFMVEIDAARLASVRETRDTDAVAAGEIRDATSVGLMVRLYAHYCRSLAAGVPPDVFAIDSIGVELLAASMQIHSVHERRRPRWLATVLEVLHDGEGDPMSVTALAASVGVHPVYLARVFRRVHGCTMAQYLAKMRVRRACALLASRDRSLAQIAAVLGFADQSHFTRTFTSVAGAPPGAYRKLLRSRPLSA